jgi:hypothetical protein
MGYIEDARDDPISYYLQDVRPELHGTVDTVAQEIAGQPERPDITTVREMAGRVILRQGFGATPQTVTRIALAARLRAEQPEESQQ